MKNKVWKQKYELSLEKEWRKWCFIYKNKVAFPHSFPNKQGETLFIFNIKIKKEQIILIINKTGNCRCWKLKLVPKGLFPSIFLTIEGIGDIFFNYKLKLN